jgi:hypothetical protein
MQTPHRVGIRTSRLGLCGDATWAGQRQMAQTPIPGEALQRAVAVDIASTRRKGSAKKDASWRHHVVCGETAPPPHTSHSPIIFPYVPMSHTGFGSHGVLFLTSAVLASWWHWSVQVRGCVCVLGCAAGCVCVRVCACVCCRYWTCACVCVGALSVCGGFAEALPTHPPHCCCTRISSLIHSDLTTRSMHTRAPRAAPRPVSGPGQVPGSLV